MSKRSVFMLAGVLLVLGIGGFVAYKSSWVRSWFGRDAENLAELQQLASAKLEPAKSETPDWPQWRGPNRDGIAPAGPFRTDWDKTPPKTLWTAPLGGGYSSFAVVGDRLYTQDRSAGGERVVCLDAATGKLVWQHSYAADYSSLKAGYAVGPRATPTVIDGRVYTVGATGKFLCIEPPKEAGTAPRVMWEHDLLAEFDARMPIWGVACSPLVEGDTMIVQPGGRGASVVAFDRETGSVKWKSGNNPAGYSSPVAATLNSTRIIFAFAGDALLAIRASNGELLDTYPWKTDHNGNIATPLAVGEYVFITSAYNKGCALLRVAASGDRVKFEEVYARNNRVLRSHHASPVLKDGFLFGFDGTRSTLPRCVDLRKGIEVPEWGEESEVKSATLILAGEHLITFSERGDVSLIAANPKEFTVVATLAGVVRGSDLWALPVLAGGRLFLRGGDSVVCLDVK
jgi:outer membrane protein assembly factor BamB